MSKKFVTRVVPVMLLALAACGGGSDSGSSSGLEAEVSKALVEGADTGGLPFSVDKEMADCITSAVLKDSAFKDNLQKGYDEGLKGQELLDSVGDPESETDMTRLMFSCFSSGQFAELLAGQIEDQSTVTDEKKQCITDEFDKMGNEAVVDGFIAFSSNDKTNENATKLTTAMISCFGLESFG